MVAVTGSCVVVVVVVAVAVAVAVVVVVVVVVVVKPNEATRLYDESTEGAFNGRVW